MVAFVSIVIAVVFSGLILWEFVYSSEYFS